MIIQWVRVMVFNATFHNTSIISWRSVLLVEETGENHRFVSSHWQTLSHTIVSSTPRLSGIIQCTWLEVDIVYTTSRTFHTSAHCLTDWLIRQHTVWLIDWYVSTLFDWLIDTSAHCLTDWLLRQHTVWQIDWYVSTLFDALIDT